MRRPQILRFHQQLILILVGVILTGCQPAPDGDAGGNGSGNADTAQGTWNADEGLTLQKDGASLVVGAGANPSSATLTLRTLTDAELRAGNLPANQGFVSGVEAGPAGTTFGQPVRFTVPITGPVVDTLPVLVFDEASGRWGGAGVSATVAADRASASFEVTHFSSYQVWNPPPPQGTVPIGDGETIAGSGFFEGQPFSTLPNPHAGDASLTYSPFGDFFALAITQLDATNPVTGDFFALSAGLHATDIRENQGTRVGLVTPLGAPSGPSIYNDGGLNKPVAGLMYLRKSATQWLVDVYCAFEGGIIFGLASGNL